MRFKDIYGPDGEPLYFAVVILHQLLAERPAEANVSHAGKLPSMEEHHAFVRSRPYRYWFLIGEVIDGDDTPVGALYATHANEIGIFIFKAHQQRGFGKRAIREFVKQHDPLPVGRRQWLANVAPKNWKSKALFESLDGRIVQLTYELPRGG